jgi:hypothetical protein
MKQIGLAIFSSVSAPLAVLGAAELATVDEDEFRRASHLLDFGGRDIDAVADEHAADFSRSSSA